MKNTEHISDELINSFVDNQLSIDEKNQLLEAINVDATLVDQVCDVQRLKFLVSHSYERLPKTSRQPSYSISKLLKYRGALAAMLVLAVGTLSGWLAHNWCDPVNFQSSKQAVYYVKPSQLAAKWTGQQNVVLHIGSSDPKKLKAGLDHTEYLLSSYRHAGRPIQMELVVSGGGLDLLRADVSPYANRIKTMKETYSTLDFIACRQTLDRYREKGVDIKLLPEARLQSSSALDEVMLRLQQGWTYVSI